MDRAHEAARRAARPQHRRQPDQRDRSRRRGRRGGSRRRRLRRPGPARRAHRRARPASSSPRGRCRYRPAPSRIAQLAALARRRRLDLIHAYEWPPCLDAYYGATSARRAARLHGARRCRSRRWSRARSRSSWAPRRSATRRGATHRAPVWVLEPPIDVDGDHPGIDGTRVPARRTASATGRCSSSRVSRLALDLKLDALVDAIDAVDLLAADSPVRLAIVGGGPPRRALAARADAVNRALGTRGRDASPGALPDPRAAYAAADVVVGMGSSALRAHVDRPAGRRPGRARLLAAARARRPAAHVLRHGFWGLGDGRPRRRAAGRAAARRSSPTRRCAPSWARTGAASWRSGSRSARGRAPARDLRAGPRARPQPSAADAATAAGRALQIELDNHDPRRKRARRRTEQALLAAASRARAPRMASRARPLRWRELGRAGRALRARTAGTTPSSPTGTWPSGCTAHAPVLYVDPPDVAPDPLQQAGGRRVDRAGPRLRQLAPRLARFTPLVAPKPTHPAMLGADVAARPAPAPRRGAAARRRRPGGRLDVAVLRRLRRLRRAAPRVLVAGRSRRRRRPLGRERRAARRRPSSAWPTRRTCSSRSMRERWTLGGARARDGVPAQRLRRGVLRDRERTTPRRRTWTCPGRSRASSATSTAGPTWPCSRRSPTRASRCS